MGRNKNSVPYLPTSWDDVPLLLDISDAALILGYTPERLKQLSRINDPEKRFPAGKFGGRWRVDKNSLRSYLQKNGIVNGEEK